MTNNRSNGRGTSALHPNAGHHGSTHPMSASPHNKTRRPENEYSAALDSAAGVVNQMKGPNARLSARLDSESVFEAPQKHHARLSSRLDSEFSSGLDSQPGMCEPTIPDTRGAKLASRLARDLGSPDRRVGSPPARLASSRPGRRTHSDLLQEVLGEDEVGPTFWTLAKLSGRPAGSRRCSGPHLRSKSLDESGPGYPQHASLGPSALSRAVLRGSRDRMPFSSASPPSPGTWIPGSRVLQSGSRSGRRNSEELPGEVPRHARDGNVGNVGNVGAAVSAPLARTRFMTASVGGHADKAREAPPPVDVFETSQPRRFMSASVGGHADKAQEAPLLIAVSETSQKRHSGGYPLFQRREKEWECHPAFAFLSQGTHKGRLDLESPSATLRPNGSAVDSTAGLLGLVPTSGAGIRSGQGKCPAKDGALSCLAHLGMPGQPSVGPNGLRGLRGPANQGTGGSQLGSPPKNPESWESQGSGTSMESGAACPRTVLKVHVGPRGATNQGDVSWGSRMPARQTESGAQGAGMPGIYKAPQKHWNLDSAQGISQSVSPSARVSKQRDACCQTNTSGGMRAQHCGSPPGRQNRTREPLQENLSQEEVYHCRDVQASRAVTCLVPTPLPQAPPKLSLEEAYQLATGRGGPSPTSSPSRPPCRNFGRRVLEDRTSSFGSGAFVVDAFLSNLNLEMFPSRHASPERDVSITGRNATSPPPKAAPACRHQPTIHSQREPDPTIRFLREPDRTIHFLREPDPAIHSSKEPGPNRLLEGDEYYSLDFNRMETSESIFGTRKRDNHGDFRAKKGVGSDSDADSEDYVEARQLVYEPNPEDWKSSLTEALLRKAGGGLARPVTSAHSGHQQSRLANAAASNSLLDCGDPQGALSSTWGTRDSVASSAVGIGAEEFDADEEDERGNGGRHLFLTVNPGDWDSSITELMIRRALKE